MFTIFTLEVPIGCDGTSV